MKTAKQLLKLLFLTGCMLVGTVNADAHETKGDIVSGQGSLNVTADTLTLKEGFEVAKGSTFEFNNR